MTAAGKPAKSKAAPDKFKAVGRLNNKKGGININVDELKLLIINRGLTIDKVAELLGISRKAIYNKMYSKNKRFNFTPGEAKKLAEILNIDVSMLL